jgi:hypothetical protein
VTKFLLLIALLTGAVATILSDQCDRIAATLRPVVSILSHQRDRIGAVR